MKLSDELYRQAALFHGHFGPGLAIGFRVANQALVDLGVEVSQTKALVCITETQTCPADAIQVCLGLTFGKGGLIYLPSGKIAFSFYHKDTGESVRYIFTGKKPKYFDRKAWEAYILEADFDEIFERTVPRLALPKETRLYDDLQCDSCHEWISRYRTYEIEGKSLCYECAQSTLKLDPNFQSL